VGLSYVIAPAFDSFSRPGDGDRRTSGFRLRLGPWRSIDVARFVGRRQLRPADDTTVILRRRIVVQPWVVRSVVQPQLLEPVVQQPIIWAVLQQPVDAFVQPIRAAGVLCAIIERPELLVAIGQFGAVVQPAELPVFIAEHRRQHTAIGQFT
jgi:hypothetical protein